VGFVGGVEIKVRKNGPYKVTGHVRVVDAAGIELTCPEGKAVALCRCGNSQTKPFCDASHRRVGWVADSTSAR
jgi:CDGSH-type Zn-finger protein